MSDDDLIVEAWKRGYACIKKGEITEKDKLIEKQQAEIEDLKKIQENKEKFYKKLSEDNEFYVSEIEKKDKIIVLLLHELERQDEGSSASQILKRIERKIEQ